MERPVSRSSAVGRFSAEQVAAAEARAKQLITLARLDPHVLETGDAEPVLALLAPHQVEALREQLTPGNERQTAWITTKLAPGFTLLPATPRVTGSMSADLDAKGELSIKTNYIVAYAFRPPASPVIKDPMQVIVLVREQVEYTWVDDPAYGQSSQGMHFGDIRSHTYAANCEWFKKGYLAPSYSETAKPSGTPARPTEQYFDPTIPIPTESNC
ncbi:hypothetical protein AB0L82_20915 [Nocardia sp. NPDC052001]|uniref:hypothetical protein n=1 Tax=Nocardia sp. NPDC052001 TaxID=3154853 RepID=UPI003431B3C6